MTTSARPSTLRLSHFVVFGIAAAAFGIVVFGVMAWSAVTVERIDEATARARFDAIRASLGDAPALLRANDDGRIVRVEAEGLASRGTEDSRGAPGASASSRSETSPRLKHLGILVWRAREERLMRADVPFWFFRLKAPAVQLVVRDTGFDLERLRLTAPDLEEHGPGLILDEIDENGDRTLIWTE